MQALARRLQSLQASVNATAALANGSNKLAAQASTWNAAAGGGAAAAGPAAASGPLDGAALLAKRRVLRVIVGKGLHSSGGEASLPRCGAQGLCLAARSLGSRSLGKFHRLMTA